MIYGRKLLGVLCSTFDVSDNGTMISSGIAKGSSWFLPRDPQVKLGIILKAPFGLEEECGQVDL